ncbi:MAG: hypothetical protein E6J01_00175 [Chloroflexi bacterium]|nr:MAG: hypothetical protein E6J01_00175 [Chloroflexota bacterium]
MVALAAAVTLSAGLLLGAVVLLYRWGAARGPLAALAVPIAAGSAATAGALAFGLRRLSSVGLTVALALLGGTLGPATAGSAAASVTPATVIPVTAPAVWPTPQQHNTRTDGFALSSTVVLVTGATTDFSAVRVVEKVLTSAGVTRVVTATDQQPPPAAPVIVWVGGPSEIKASGGALNALGIAGPAGLAAEGYVLGIGRGADGQARVVLAGVDTTGTFYAAQTFRQLVVPRRGHTWLPGVSIRDWPTMPLRGVIEGFYGPPWSSADRLSQLDFLASTKQNVYVYSPKDDPYLRAQWRQPYPPDQLAAIRQVVDRADLDHVQLTYALSPGLSVCYSSDSDEQALVDKLKSIWDIGVRSFAIPLDDISYTRWNCGTDVARFGTGGAAAGQAQASLLNRVQNDFIETHATAHRLEMVPTEFSGVGDSPYKAALRGHLDPRVTVEWTGGGIVPATITADQAGQARQVFGHDILVWDNYPVNDYAPQRLFLGPYTGRDPRITDNVVGVTVNPMIESEPSKIAEFTSGAFLWNPTSYEAPAAWLAGLHQLGGSAWQALRVFAESNSSCVLNLAESPTLTSLISAFWTSYESGTNVGGAAAALSSYFGDMAAVPERLKAGMDDTAFLAEAGPWIDRLGLYGRAGQVAVALLVAQRAGDLMSVRRNGLALASLRNRLAATSQVVAPGIIDPFIARAAGGSVRGALDPLVPA